MNESEGNNIQNNTSVIEFRPEEAAEEISKESVNKTKTMVVLRLGIRRHDAAKRKSTEGIFKGRIACNINSFT